MKERFFRSCWSDLSLHQSSRCAKLRGDAKGSIIPLCLDVGDLNVCLQTQQVVRIETVVLVEMILQFITKPQLDTLDEEVHPIAVVVKR